MNCAYCGRKRGPFETFTKHDFCPACNQKVRNYLSRSLARLAREVPLCAPEASPGEVSSAELLARIDRLLELIEKLETMRPRVPFFKSGTGEYQQTLAAFRARVESGEVPPNVAVADETLHEEKRRRERFREQLATLPQAAISPSGDEEARLPATKASIVCSRVLPVTKLAKISSFVALSIQTTGLNHRRCEIIEASAVKFDGFAPVYKLSTLVIPRHAIPPSATRETGVTNEMVCGAPLVGEVIPALQEFIRGYPLVGYHLDFDLKFLCQNGLVLDEPERKFYDLYQTAEFALVRRPSRRVLGPDGEELPFDVEDYSLESLCAYCGVDRGGERRGAADCLAMGLVFERLARDITARKFEDEA